PPEGGGRRPRPRRAAPGPASGTPRRPPARRSSPRAAGRSALPRRHSSVTSGPVRQPAGPIPAGVPLGQSSTVLLSAPWAYRHGAPVAPLGPAAAPPGFQRAGDDVGWAGR